MISHLSHTYIKYPSVIILIISKLYQTYIEINYFNYMRWRDGARTSASTWPRSSG